MNENCTHYSSLFSYVVTFYITIPIEYIKQFKAYSHNLSRLKSKELQDFTKLTREIVNSPAVMNHISGHDRELAMQIKETFKQHEIEHSMHYERSLSFGKGFSL